MPPRKRAAVSRRKSAKLSAPSPSVDADVADPTVEITPTAEEVEIPSKAVEGSAVDESQEIGEKAVEIPLEKAVEGDSKEHCGEDDEIEAKEAVMDVDKEGDKNIVEDKVIKDDVDAQEHLVEKVDINKGTTHVRHDPDDIDYEANEKETSDDEEDEEEPDEEDEEEPAEEDEEEVDHKEDVEEAVDKANEEEVEEENKEDAKDKENKEEADAEDHAALYSLTEKNRQKNFEIFVRGLEKGVSEEDLIKAFGAFGEIQSVKIAKNPLNRKSRGFAFVCYASVEHARKVLTEMKDGIEVKGKLTKISASNDNNTLHIANIHKTWTKEQVIEALKGYGIEQIEDIVLPNDNQKEGRIKGFGFLEFVSHSDAMTAYQRLTKPDALFGRDVSAKVSFAQTPLHPSEESELEVKAVYIQGIPGSWDEEKLKDLCKKYGEIEKIELPKKFASYKSKGFGFVHFCSRDAALACVEGINGSQTGEGDVSVKASFAKPAYNGRLAKQSAKGGFKVNKDGAAAEADSLSNRKKKAKSSVVDDKDETQPKLKRHNVSKPSNSHGEGSDRRKGKMSRSFNGTKRGRQGTNTGTSEQAFKRTRSNQNHGKPRGRPSTVFDNRSSYPHQPTHASHYAMPAGSYSTHAYAGNSRSNYQRSDLEPHAGYIPAAQQVRNPYEYDPRRGAYASQTMGSSGYPGAPLSHTPYPPYPPPPQYPSYPGYQAGYSYPNYGAHGCQGPYQ